MKEKIRICFIGCGQFARHFVPLFQQHPACEFVAVCDKFPERAQEYMDKFHVDKIFDTFEHLEEQNKRLQHQLVVGQEIEGCQRNCQERRRKTTPRVHDSQVYA